MDDDFNAAAAIGHSMTPSCWPTGCWRTPRRRPRTCAAGRWRGCARDLLGCGETLGIFQRDPAAFLLARRDRQCARLGIDAAAVEARIEERAAARAAKDFARADEIRQELREQRIELMDGPTGTTWRVV